MANPKLAMIPTGYKAGKVYSVLPESGVGDFTFDRDSSATRVNEDGLIETMANDVPRLDYTDSGCPSLLLEPERTNLIPYSENFTTFSDTRCTVTSNQAISPDGTQSADLMTSTGDDARIELQVGSSGAEYTQSIYVKSAQVSDVDCQIDFAGLNTVTFTANQQWQRVETTLTDTSIVPRLRLRILETGNSVYVWGGQLEQGEYETSYIPTNGTSKTRVGETCNGAGDASTFNDSEGVLMAEISALTNDDDTLRWINLSNGLTTNRVAFYYRTDINQLTYLVTSNGVSSVFLTITLSSASSFNKIVAKYKQNDFALWINGFEVATDTSGNTPIGLNELSFDNAVGGDNFYGNTKQIQYFNSALTDAEIETLTSWQSFLEMANAQNYTII